MMFPLHIYTYTHTLDAPSPDCQKRGESSLVLSGQQIIPVLGAVVSSTASNKLTSPNNRETASHWHKLECDGLYKSASR